MNRRDFLKRALTVAALASVSGVVAKEGKDGDKSSEGKGRPITRRRYKDTALTLPLLGFGMMRLPRLSPDKPDIDYPTVEKQIARAMEVGLNYFDTAYFYHDGLSEKCAGDLLSRYPRDRYYLVTKMPVRALKKEADVERIWNEQLAKCKTDYFDFYLVHNLNRDRWEDTRRFHVYEFLKQKQKEGRIRKLGFSFHDEPEVLKIYAKHYRTGEVIPAALIEKLDKSGKYGQGFATTEYLAASLLDMDYHVLKEIPRNMDVTEFEAAVLKERGLLSQIPPRYRTTYFNHIMNSGYTAGYYSYIWAEVLDSDAFEAYKETGDLFNQEVASRFRRYILTPGGIDDAMDMYKNFRGKEPGIEPLLRNRGL